MPVNNPGSSFTGQGLDRYCDYVNGSDNYDGKAPNRAYKTIQAAYNALKTEAIAGYTADSNGRLGVGRVFLAPGNHDVGAAGLVLDARYGVEVIGTRSGHRNHDQPNSSSRIVCTSATPTEMVLISRASTIGMGFAFKDVAFTLDQAVATSITKIIYAKTLDHIMVDNCSFDTADNTTNTSATAIYLEDIGSGGDFAWSRITRCNSADMQFLKMASTDGTGAANFNRFNVSDNVVFYGGAIPMISVAAAVHGGLFSNNNLEGTATALQIGANSPAATTCLFLNNSGEDTTTGTPNPFYDFTASVFQMVIIGGSVTTSGPPASAKEFAKFAAGASNNLVIGPFDKTGNTSQARKITDNSTLGVRILDTNAGFMARYKTSAGTISDADYSKTPDNGAWAVTYA